MREKIADRIKLHTTGSFWTAEGLADAVLDALMEPTEGMVDAGTARDDGADQTNALGVFRAMIQAAKEGE